MRQENCNCYDCHYLGMMGMETACVNRKSPKYGPIEEFHTACPLYASRQKAYSEAPKRRKWFRVKSVYDMDIQGARL